MKVADEERDMADEARQIGSRIDSLYTWELDRYIIDHRENLAINNIRGVVALQWLVGSVPCVRKVAVSNPALVATYGPWASPSLAVACSASAC